MDRQELRKVCEELSKVGDARAKATLELFDYVGVLEERVKNAKYILNKIASSLSLVGPLVDSGGLATVASSLESLDVPGKIDTIADTLDISREAKTLMHTAASVERGERQADDISQQVPPPSTQGGPGERDVPAGTLGDVPQVGERSPGGQGDVPA